LSKIAPVEFILDQSRIQSFLFIWCVHRKPAPLMTVMKRFERQTFVEKRAIYYRTTTIWNSLDLTLKLSKTTSIFKKASKRKLIVEFLNS